jgi:hypothetical protein
VSIFGFHLVIPSFFLGLSGFTKVYSNAGGGGYIKHFFLGNYRIENNSLRVVSLFGRLQEVLFRKNYQDI